MSGIDLRITLRRTVCAQHLPPQLDLTKDTYQDCLRLLRIGIIGPPRFSQGGWGGAAQAAMFSKRAGG